MPGIGVDYAWRWRLRSSSPTSISCILLGGIVSFSQRGEIILRLDVGEEEAQTQRQVSPILGHVTVLQMNGTMVRRFRA